MSYNQYPQYPNGQGFYQQYPGQPVEPSKKGKGKMTCSDWITKVWVPILVALIGAGIFGGIKVAQSQPSIPQLKSSYLGSMIRTFDNMPFSFRLQQVSEKSNGSFTASATIEGCPTNISGMADDSSNIRFTGQESQICQDTGLTASFIGVVNSDGSLSGTWSSTTRNGQDIGGSWTLQ